MKNEPSISITFTYDHASGLYTAHLPNGARFTFDRSAVSGRLQNALSLFAKGVVNSQGGKWRKPQAKPEFDYTYSESEVRRFSDTGKPTAPPLNLSLEDLNDPI